tara:strand:- start:4746 stop:5024 length:279 start_codon:yes stop_codon:yes gene_type:complete
MKVKEILSHHINEDFGVVYVDFIIEDGNQEKEINNLEIPEEELTQLCELYQSKEWVDWETEDVMNIKGEIDEDALVDGVEFYINNTETILNL